MPLWPEGLIPNPEWPTPDALNPDYMFQTTATDLLIGIVDGTIDPIERAVAELTSRGHAPERIAHLEAKREGAQT